MLVRNASAQIYFFKVKKKNQFQAISSGFVHSNTVYMYALLTHICLINTQSDSVAYRIQCRVVFLKLPM